MDIKFNRIIVCMQVVFLILSGYIVFAPQPIEADQGGPDDWGYIWTDTNSPPPTATYDWDEIRLTGNNVGALGDDSEYGPFPIGFTFNFYGENKNTFLISNNGIISFRNESITYTNIPIPSTSTPNDFIAAFWDDLDSETGNITYQTKGLPPNRYLIVEWYNMNHFSALPGTITFQIILYEGSNYFKMQYQDVCFEDLAYDWGQSATVGIENKTGAIGLEYLFNSPVLTNGTAIEFSKNPHNLAIRNFHASDYVFVGKPFYANASIMNTGENTETWVEVNFTVNGNLEDQRLWISLDPGNSFDVNFTYTPSQNIEHFIEINITPAPDETYLGDNYASKLLVLDIPSIGYPSTSPMYPNATSDVNITAPIDDYFGVENATLWYSYDNSTWFNTSMMDVGGGGTTYENDVESGQAGWIHYNISGPAQDNWTITATNSMSPINSWYSDFEQGDLWGDSCLESPIIANLPPNTNLSFWHWYHFSLEWDGGLVEINDGGGWVQIYPVGGYDGIITEGYQNPIQGKWAFLDISSGWEQETFDVSAYAGQDIRIRFHVGWDDIDDGPTEGWYIDDIMLYNEGGGWSGIIPAFGSTTTVYYYVNATDLEGNSNESTTFTYYADGILPDINYITPSPGLVTSDEAITITTNVSDDFMLGNVWLWFDNGTGWSSILMDYVSGNSTLANYTAVIPATHSETSVSYYISVFDVAKNQNISAPPISYTTNFPPQILDIQSSPEFPSGSSIVTITANISDSNNINTATLYFSTDDGQSYSSQPMNVVIDPTYSSDIAPLGFTALVYYYINATDTLGLLTSSDLHTFLVDASPPDFSIPSIAPQYPNATETVNVSLSIIDAFNITDANLHYSYDTVSWSVVPMILVQTSGTAMFEEEFPSTTIDSTKWASTVDTPLINSNGLNPISPPYSLNLNGNLDTVTSIVMDLSSYYNLTIQFYYEMGGGGEAPDANNWIYLEYYTSAGNWTILWGKEGETSNDDFFTSVNATLPADAYHSNFQFRFRAAGDSGFDDWYIDDVIFSGGSMAYALIPGPGNPSWVYYYFDATDAAGNSNTSVTHSYLAAYDVIIEDVNITFDPISPMENQTAIYVNATIYNALGQIEDVEVRFYLGDPDLDDDNILDAGANEIGTPDIVNIPMTSEAHVSTTWTVPENGSFDIYIWVDPLNSSWEWTEYNNLAHSSFFAFQWVDNFLDESKISYIDNVSVRGGDAFATGGDIKIGLVQEGAWNDYVTLINNINDSYSDLNLEIVMLPAGPSPENLTLMNLVVFDGYMSTQLNLSEIAVYQDYYDNGGSLWITFDDVSDHDWNNSFEVLIGAAKLEDIPDSQQITFTEQFFPNGAPIDVYGEVFDFGQSDQENITPDSCVILDSGRHISILDGSGKYVMYFGETIESVSNLSASGVLGRLFSSFLNMSGLGGGDFGQLISEEIFIPANHMWDVLYVDKTEPPNAYLNVSVLDGSTGEIITGFENLTLGEIDLNAMDPLLHPSIKLLGNFVGSSPNYPTLHYWAVNWVYLIADAGSDFSIDEDTEFGLDASGSQSSGGIASFEWDIDETDGLDWVSPDLEGIATNHTYLDPGVYTATLKVTDIYGNWMIDNLTITVEDITSPIANPGPNNSTEIGNIVVLNGSASSDNVGIVLFQWDIDTSNGIDFVSPDYTGMEIFHTYPSAITYTVTLRVTDAEGNYATGQTNITIYDYEDPIVEIGGDITINEDVNHQFSSFGTQDNSGEIISFNWSFGDGEFLNGSTSTVQNPSHRYSDPGTYIVTLTVSDPSGNINSTSITVTVRDTTNPSANAGPDDEVNEDVYYEFNGTGSTDNSGVIRWYNWTFGDGNTEEGNDPTPRHRYTDPGRYTVKLKVTDSWGLWDEDTMRLDVLDATDPIASAGSPDTVQAGISYEFDGSLSSDNVEIINYLWDIDDSDGLNFISPDYTGIWPIHTFTEARQYTVTLMVEDAVGNSDTDTVIITVTPLEGADEIPPSEPENLEITLVAEGGALELTWEEPTTNSDGSFLDDLDHYEIYYRRGSSGDFDLLTEVDERYTSYTHDGLTDLREYQYYIVAVDINSNPSSPSDTESGTPDVDTDGDGIGNFEDPDDDNDDYLDEDDAFPLDPDRWSEEKAGGEGGGIPWMYLIIIILIVVVVVVLVVLMKTRKKEEPADQGFVPQQAQNIPQAWAAESAAAVSEPVALTPPPPPKSIPPPPPTKAIPPPPEPEAPPVPPPKEAAKATGKIRCPHCRETFEIQRTGGPQEILCPHCGTKGKIG